MEKRYQVFVSSTYTDLKDERKKIIQTLMEMDCIPAVMEVFPAADQDQFEFIKKVIDDCDYYLLIIGGRYGQTTAEGLSFTEKEYDYAIEKGLDAIVLIHDKPNEIALEKSDTTPELVERLNKFREKVQRNRLVRFWNSSSDLCGIVAVSLLKTIKTRPAIGWVRADQVSNTELLSELNEIRKSKEHLEIENKSLSAKLDTSIFSSREETEFNFIYEKLRGFHFASGRCIAPTDPPGNKRTEFLSKFSVVRLIYYATLAGDAVFTSEISSYFSDEIFESKSFKKFLTKEYEFPSLTAEREVQGLMVTAGLLTPQHRTLTDSEYRERFLYSVVHDSTIFMFSDKMYRFALWINEYKKINNEPKIEFVKFVKSED